MDDNRKKALAAALSQIEKQFGKGSVMRLGDSITARDVEVVSTGSLGLDVALGVAEDLLAEHGAVSEAVACALATGARQRAAADVAVAVSGIAGPGGGSAEKPVGTVWFAWAYPDGLSSEQRRFSGGRDAVRRFAVAQALEGLRACAAPHDI